MATKFTVTQKEFEEFRIKFSEILQERGLSCEAVAEDSLAKEYLANYVQQNVINEKIKNDIRSISYRLSNLRLNKYGKDKMCSEIEYPVINKYLGRLLLGTYFFEKLPSGEIQEVFIEFKKSPIILN